MWSRTGELRPPRYRFTPGLRQAVTVAGNRDHAAGRGTQRTWDIQKRGEGGYPPENVSPLGPPRDSGSPPAQLAPPRSASGDASEPQRAGAASRRRAEGEGSEGDGVGVPPPLTSLSRASVCVRVSGCGRERGERVDGG